MPGFSRKDLLLRALASALPIKTLANLEGEVGLEELRAAAKVVGVSFSDAELKAILPAVRANRSSADSLRGEGFPNALDTATRFVPLGGGSLAGKVEAKASGLKTRRKGLSDKDLAFLTVAELGHLVQTRQVRSRELAELFLGRLKRHNPRLLCVINLTEERALLEADAADREIAAGHYRGPLHGIPYGVKDLFAARGAPTTWGAGPYESQVLDFDAAVVERLARAGAVLVAKLSCGALAMDDQWFGGQTKNPWNVRQGSSGSSAGSASATAAGLVPFAIGTETLGSIVSPAIRCRTTGLRPTYGRVSRFGGMILSPSTDKVGPICRTAMDAALVLSATIGEDARDPSAVHRPFVFPRRRALSSLKVGVLVAPNRRDAPLPENQVTKSLRAKGVAMRPVSFSPVPPGTTDLLDAESAAFFDGLTRHPEEIAKLKNSLWPDIFRAGRFLSAVDYLNAQRARTRLMHLFETEFGDLDLFVASGGGYTLAHTNLTGHPQVVIPQTDGSSVSLVGRLYDEATLCQVAWTLQQETLAYRLRPPLE